VGQSAAGEATGREASLALSAPRRWELADGATLTLDPDWLGASDANRVLCALLEEIDWKQRTIRVMGRDVLQPRLSAWYGDAAYTYSGVTLTPLPWTPLLAGLRDRVIADVGERFNSVLCNLYRTGSDSMGLHADDEKELGPNPVIASVSLGATRRLVLRHKKRRAAPLHVDLTSGSLLVMGPATQSFYRHEVPKDPRAAGPRVNLTFRWIVPS